jgi:hypothetical protein
MTRVRGVLVRAAPCCGARYAFPRYLSMNFSAFEYWTDGWLEMSLMPNDEGLRRCQCGRYLLLRDLVSIGEADDSDLPSMDRVPGDDLPQCLLQADSEAVEVAARLEYWRHLNHAYRDRYRQHRDAEEAGTRARWEARHPDTRSWWDRLRGRPPTPYVRPPDSPFTFPSFEPSEAQRANMARLVDLLGQQRAQGEAGLGMELAELLRELGRFEEAAEVMAGLDAADDPVTVRLMNRLIRERQTAPMRYRL